MVRIKFLFRVLRANMELFCWLVFLIIIATMDLEGEHFSFCILSILGLDFCPGCGIGHSIGYIFNGRFVQSFQCHPLGIPALAAIIYRIYKLIINFNLYHLKTRYYG